MVPMADICAAISCFSAFATRTLTTGTTVGSGVAEDFLHFQTATTITTRTSTTTEAPMIKLRRSSRERVRRSCERPNPSGAEFSRSNCSSGSLSGASFFIVLSPVVDAQAPFDSQRVLDKEQTVAQKAWSTHR